MSKTQILYSKEVDAAWYVLKEFIDPANCSVLYDKQAIPMYYKDVLRHYYSGTKVFNLFGYSKEQLSIHLGQDETHYYRSKRYAEHYSGYGRSDKQAQSLSFAKELGITTKKKKLKGAYVLLLGIDIDAHKEEPDVEQLAEWLRTTHFTLSYWEPSTGGKGRHGYVKVGYQEDLDLDYVKSVIQDVFKLLDLKVKQLGFMASLDVPCGLPISLKYNNDIKTPTGLPKITLKEYGKYRQIREKLQKGESIKSKFISVHYNYDQIDKIINTKLPVDIISSQCIKLPRFNHSDKKANMDDIISFHKLDYVDFNGFIKLRDELNEELKIEPEKMKKDVSDEKGGEGESVCATIVSSPNGNSKKQGLLTSNNSQKEEEGGGDCATIVSSPKELGNKKSYKQHIEDVRKITDKAVQTNKFYFYFSDYLGYVPDVSVAIDEYIKQKLNTNTNKNSTSRLRRFKVTKDWLDAKWDINKRGFKLDDWNDLKDEIIAVVNEKLVNVKKEYTKYAKRKQVYPIPIEELAFIYFVIWKSNCLDAGNRSSRSFSFSLKQVQQHLFACYKIKCHKTKAVAILKILKDAEIIDNIGTYVKGLHGNRYDAVDWNTLKKQSNLIPNS